ncbi:AraC family transcriptional regulator [Clostridioides difficile]|nr:AraC family transcriptional regulator [Clostridioides difficile]MDB0441219.1 AraC family transcriptional regulator [Clostridioides difficile]
MKTNLETIQDIIDYIDLNLEEKLDLDSIAKEIGYSKYHLSRMFVNIIGFTVHNYIQRRRLTEAARLLIFTDKSIMEISLFAGYETQQSFTIGFKALFKCSPQSFRKRGNFHPIQLKFTVDGKETLRGDRIMEVKIVENDKILLVGYKGNTCLGFSVIGECVEKIYSKKYLISNRRNIDFTIGLNDYSQYNENQENQPAFDYYAVVEVNFFDKIPEEMVIKELPPSKYIVFSFKANREDSLQPVVDYAYKEWLPQSTCQLNENAKFDFARYGELVDKDGKSLIEYWVPIL